MQSVGGWMMYAVSGRMGDGVCSQLGGWMMGYAVSGEDG